MRIVHRQLRVATTADDEAQFGAAQAYAAIHRMDAMRPLEALMAVSECERVHSAVLLAHYACADHGIAAEQVDTVDEAVEVACPHDFR